MWECVSHRRHCPAVLLSLHVKISLLDFLSLSLCVFCFFFCCFFFSFSVWVLLVCVWISLSTCAYIAAYVCVCDRDGTSWLRLCWFLQQERPPVVLSVARANTEIPLIWTPWCTKHHMTSVCECMSVDGGMCVNICVCNFLEDCTVCVCLCVWMKRFLCLFIWVCECVSNMGVCGGGRKAG